MSAMPRWRCMLSHFHNSPETKLYWGNRTLHMALTLLNGCNSGAAAVEITHPLGNWDAVAPGYPWTLSFPLHWCDDVHRDLKVPVPPANPDFYSSGGATWEEYAKWEDVLYRVAKMLQANHVKVLRN